MKILVFLHSLQVGGVEWNGIELAAALRDFHGHDVVLFGAPGPMTALAKAKGLRFLPAPEPHTYPSVDRMRALCAVVRDEAPDLVQAWDYRAGLDAYYSAHLVMRVPMHLAHSCMDLHRLLPKRLPTTFMTPALVEQARALGRAPVGLLLPPVDVHLNSPGAVDTSDFRRVFGIKPHDLTIVTVSRLVAWLKAESIQKTIEAVGSLGRRLPVRFVVVGDGPARPALQNFGDAVNAALGREAVTFTGALLDPRPAYAAADVVIGMGGSSLRAMAFGKPVIIAGEGGFSAPFDEESAAWFYHNGMYGYGGSGALLEHLAALIDDGERRLRLGAFGRDFILARFSLESVAASLSEFSEIAVSRTPRIHVSLADAARTMAVKLGHGFVPRRLRNFVRRREQARTASFRQPGLPARI